MSTESDEPESSSVLFIDDDPDIVKAARLLLMREGIAVTGAASPDAAWPLLAGRSFDVILLDLNFARGQTSGAEGFAMLDRLLAADRNAIIVVVTGHSGINIAVQAMRAGASDFVIKPWNNERLVATVQRATDLRRAKTKAAPDIAANTEDRLLLGEDASIVRARDTIARVAPTGAAVLIQGPAGSGKSLAARALHHASALADQPLVTLAAGTPLSDADIIDAAARARGATLLIEDVGELGAALQPTLARALSDVRVIATSCEARAELKARLDKDLLYRLNTIEITLPPLGQRGGDALLLARHFLALFAGRYGKPAKALTYEAEEAIAADSWPDDVRGLRQAMERAVLLGTGEEHGVDDFGFAIDDDDHRPRAIAADLNLTRSEKVLVEAALKRHNFNVSRAAKDLGLTRAALYRRMAKYEL
ncbi:sigma-54-dependent Fis family transcriptional regulator [Pacificimonas sp. WHA3]|uniref:Sigma-54-dependent Fis family transcriptional regulator n=1 Tax=Pacificimonas pallii TaxID=2827236 RepID=A0ABS6SG64_9SPHN|nr:response regulator [Pacificimonas pallii]MBV7257413.1 sigma-54-dependent Fis family transcriptional regulator [Pacificimonas pallii]